MHLKKTKKTPRMIRMIALMLSLVLVFFTMTGMALAFRAFGQQDGFAADVKNIVVFHPGDLRLGIFDGKRFRPFRRAEGAHGAQQAVRRTDAAAGLPQFHDG